MANGPLWPKRKLLGRMSRPVQKLWFMQAQSGSYNSRDDDFLALDRTRMRSSERGRERVFEDTIMRTFKRYTAFQSDELSAAIASC